MSPNLDSRRFFIRCLILAAFALAVIVRLRQSVQPMSYDEFASMYFSSRPFHDLWGWWMLRETNPPLFYSILRLWRMAVPESQWALRLLPLVLSLAQIAVLARFTNKTYGALSALLAVLLFALAPSDVFQSEYLRGYVLAKLAVTVSFIGLIAALGEGKHPARGWAAYVGGSLVAIYSHTTMLLWPAIATIAVLAEATLRREIGVRTLARLLAADLGIAILSSWVLWIAIAQLQTQGSNISWIQSLPIEDYASSVQLQLLLDSNLGSTLMLILIGAGLLRTIRNRVTRISLFIVLAGLLLFKVADVVHPINSDYTLHWCATFAVLLAAASLAEEEYPARRVLQRIRPLMGAIAIPAVTAVGLYELLQSGSMPEPQDFRFTVHRVAQTPAGALLVSHESMGLVMEEACKLEFHGPRCPFPLVVMKNPSRSDSWAFGGYDGPIIPAGEVRATLQPARTVYAFSRYVYTPLAQLGLDREDYDITEWDDGELIGPIPVGDFDPQH